MSGLCAFFFAGLLGAGGDILCLKDGRVVDGVPMQRRDGAVVLTYQNGEVIVADALIQDAILAVDSERPPADAAEAEQRKNGMVVYEGRWIPAKKRDDIVKKRIEDRRKAALEAKARFEWRNRQIVESKSLRFEHQLPDHLFEDYRDALEAFLATFSKTWKLETPKDRAKLPVNIYIDRKNFEQVSGVGGGILAYFRFVRPYDLNCYYDRLDPDYAQQVAFHEFVHYLEKLIDLQFAYPHFPNESVAEYYGASRWDPVARKFTTGLLQEGRLWEIQADIAAGEPAALDQLILNDESYQHYTWGWSLVHFLMNNAKLKPKFESFFVALAKAKGVRRVPKNIDNLMTCEPAEVWRVFQEELGLKNADAVRNLEVEWHDYVADLIAKNTSVSGKEKAGYKAVQLDLRFRAKRFFQEALDAGSKSPRVVVEYATILGSEGKSDQALALYDKAIALDPLNGAFYARKGRMQKALGRKEDGDRLIKLAKELGGDDKWIDIEFGDEDDDKPNPGEGKPGRGDKPAGG